jgi:hypothetical protein
MSLKKKNSKQSINKSSIVDLILTKYRADPNSFRQYLPDVAEVLDRAYPTRQSSHTPFGLTEHERAHRLAALESIMGNLHSSKVSHQDAVRALEHCAVLTEDDNLPYKVDRRSIMRLIGIILGKPLTDVTAETTIEIPRDTPSPVVNRISLVRGAVLNLTQDMHLASISVIPKKVKEGPRAMRFVAMTKKVQKTSTGRDVNPEDKHATS